MTGYIDMHCDTLGEGLSHHLKTITSIKDTMVDIKRLQRSGAAAQFFAMFLPQRNMPEWFGFTKMPEAEELMQLMYDVYLNTLRENGDILAPACSYEQLQENLSNNRISAFLTIENGYPVMGKLENLKKFHEMGVGLITLTWNDPNCFGFPHSRHPGEMSRGLTDFGKEAVSYMNELGMLIDVSHLSDGGFYDVADITAKPFVASHSNCRALSPSTRNLTDDMIRILAEHGGVAGINFEPSFLNEDLEDKKSRVGRMCDHVEHFIRVGGAECVGIGTDFDGIDGEFEIADCTGMDLFFQELHRRKLSDDFIDKIAFLNVARVIKECGMQAFFP